MGEKKKNTKVHGRRCFIITPIGNENSNTFRKAKGVIESVIKPILIGYGFDDVKSAYEINVSGLINTQIINRIIEDDLVIANLTGNNPNVMYELCLRHVVAKPIIHICEDGTSLPFDIKDNRTIFYKDDMLGVKELEDKMKMFMGAIVYEEEQMDNPIYTASKYGKLLKETQGTKENQVIQLLLHIINKLDIRENFMSHDIDFADSKMKRQREQYHEAIMKVDTDDLDKCVDKMKVDESISIFDFSRIIGMDSKVIIQILSRNDIHLPKSVNVMEFLLNKEEIFCIREYIYGYKQGVKEAGI